MSYVTRVFWSTLFPLLLVVTATWLLWRVDWRAAIGVWLFVWGNNLAYSLRLKKLLGLRV